MTKAKKKVTRKKLADCLPAKMSAEMVDGKWIATGHQPHRPLLPVTEMMTRVEFCRGTVSHRILRVWSIAKDGECGPDRRVMDALGTQRHPNDVLAHVNQVMSKLGHDVVAAYELLSVQGHGFVQYPDWK